MAQFPFIGAAYRARSEAFNGERCVNLYPEMGNQTSKNVAMLIGTPGSFSRNLIGAGLLGGPIRGMIRYNRTIAIAVADITVYKLECASGNIADGVVVTALGNINSGVGTVQMATNGIVILLVNGTTSKYNIDPVANTVTLNVENSIASNTVSYANGFFVLVDKNTNKYFASDSFSTTITTVNFGTTEGSPDLLVGNISLNREVWLFSDSSIEVHGGSGSSFPFAAIQGAYIEAGCSSPGSIARGEMSLFWLGSNEDGNNIVFRSKGYAAERISDFGVEYSIGQMTSTDDAIGFVYQQEGHTFYCLSFPSGNKTWVYDCTTKLWHERADRNPVSGELNRWRHAIHMFWLGQNWVGDTEYSKLWTLDLDTFESAAPIPRIRRCPHSFTPNYDWQFFASLQIDMEVGVGVVDSAAAGYDPQCILRISNDGGKTFPVEMNKSFGKLGVWTKRVIFRRLGKSMNRVYEVVIIEPVKIILIGAASKLEGE